MTNPRVQADEAFRAVMYIKGIITGRCFIGYKTSQEQHRVESDLLPDLVMHICIACCYRKVPEQDIGHCPDYPVIVDLSVISGYNLVGMIIDKIQRPPLLLFCMS